MRASPPAHLVWSALVAGALSLYLGAACGGHGASTPDGACPMDLPPSCPSPAPSYSTQVNDIIQTYCVPCHSPTGIESALPFVTYDDITGSPGRFTDMLGQVHACRMPPPDAAQPLEADRVALLGWLVCGAPNN